MYTFQSAGPEDTARLAEELAGWLGAGTVIALEGELGVGKTTFSQFFARALGVQETVNSPTFTIIKEYEGTNRPFYHMDVYRVSVEEADELGLDEYFYGDGVTLVEWASRIGGLLPERYLLLEIGYAEPEAADLWDPNKRVIRATPKGEVYEVGCRRMAERGVWG